MAEESGVTVALGLVPTVDVAVAVAVAVRVDDREGALLRDALPDADGLPD